MVNDDPQFIEDILALAYDHCRYVLWECTLALENPPLDGVWYSTRPKRPGYKPSIDRAIRHLEARGMLERRGELVRVKEKS